MDLGRNSPVSCLVSKIDTCVVIHDDLHGLVVQFDPLLPVCLLESVIEILIHLLVIIAPGIGGSAEGFSGKQLL